MTRVAANIGPAESVDTTVGGASMDVEPVKDADSDVAEVFSEGDVLFSAMLDDISAARERVWLESYIFADDTIGRAFMARLADCAVRGVDVRVRVDAVGSRLGLSGRSARGLRAAGVAFHWCHPWEWRRPWTFHRRNHRKLLVIDEAVAYLGGFNVSAVNSRKVHGDARWRDTHVRLSGPIVKEAADAYRAFARGDLRWSGDPSRSLYLLTNHARRCRERYRCTLQQRFAQARARIWLTTPYFVPDSVTQRRLCAAAGRGVDVRVLVPGKNDVPLVQWAGRAAYSRMLQAGVRVFEFQPRMLHAKTLLVDADWSSIGTANFDYRSFFINYELNLVARSLALNAALASHFEQDLRSAREIRTRPWALRAVSSRIAEFVGWSARHWL